MPTSRKICFLDFDATITEQDTLVIVLDRLAGADVWRPIEKEIREGRMTNIEGLRKEMNLCQISREDLTQLLQKEITIDPTFKEFLTFAKEKEIECVVLSGGFTECIEIVFKKYDITLPYFANELIFGTAYLDVRYPYERHSCGHCSHCKSFHVNRYKRRGYHTIFVGNGSTDQCPAQAADQVFAKDSLDVYCKKEGITYQSFTRFSEIQKALS